MLLAVALAGVAGLLAIGCGDGDEKPPPVVESGRFAGRSGAVGVLLEFRGEDETTRELMRVLVPQGGPWAVGIASIVNRSDELVEIPALFATLPDRRVVTLERADRIPEAQRANIKEAGRYVPARSALRVYLVYRGGVDDVRGVQMSVSGATPVSLSPRAAPRPAARG